MPKRYPQFIEGAWIRTCQECDHVQTDTKPEYGGKIPDKWTFRKCQKCHSEALDYGQENYDDDEE